jgi:hypothetical protein
LYIIIVVL